MAKREATLRAEAQPKAAAVTPDATPDTAPAATPTPPAKVGRRIVLRAARNKMTIDGRRVEVGDVVAIVETDFPLGCVMGALRADNLIADGQPLFPVTDPHVKPKT